MSGYDGVLRGVPYVGRRVREGARSTAGHREEATQRTPQDRLAHHTRTQTAPVPTRPDQEVRLHSLSQFNRPYSRRSHDEQKARLGRQIYRKFARQYVNCDVTSLLLNIPVT